VRITCESCASAKVVPETDGQRWKCAGKPKGRATSTAKYLATHKPRTRAVYVDTEETRLHSTLQVKHECQYHVTMND